MKSFPAQSFVEYALIIVTVAVLILLAGSFLGSAIVAWFQEIASKVLTTVITFGLLTCPMPYCLHG